MKILIIANYTRGAGGISGVVENTMFYLHREGFITALFNTRGTILYRLVLLLPLIARVQKFDIIHIHGCSRYGFYPVFVGILASKYFFRKRTIVTFHGGGAELFLARHWKIISTFLRRADKVTVMSEFLKNTFEKYGIHTFIVPNVVNLESDLPAEVDLSVPKLISVRSLEELYNIEDILRAFELISDRYPEASLTVLGTGSEEKELKSYCKNKELRNVVFRGKIPNNQVPAELSKANILITVPDVDNQPMSILEGFSTGILIISSKVGGVPYMIKDWETGLLVDVHSPMQIAVKVNWVMDNPEKAIGIIRSAWKELDKYRWESVRHSLLPLYES